MSAIKKPWYILRNSSGKPDGLWTMAWIAFGIWVLHAIVLGLFGGTTFTFTGAILAATWVIPNSFGWESLFGLAPLIAGYIARKHGVGAKHADPDATPPTE